MPANWLRVVTFTYRIPPGGQRYRNKPHTVALSTYVPGYGRVKGSLVLIRQAQLWKSVFLFCALALEPLVWAGDQEVEPVHQEAHEKLVAVSQNAFQSHQPADTVVDPLELNAQSAPCPLVIVVGFTGGLEGKDNSASGVVMVRDGVSERLGERQDLVVMTFNNFRWRRAATEALAHIECARRLRQRNLQVPQPQVLVYGHSWGAGSIAKFARALRRDNIHIFLAVYIDAFTLRNPRVPDNIRYVINFYQRSGILRGLPFRGKSKLILEDREATRLLGNHRIKAETEHWGWSWNFLQPLLYRHHHRIAHDPRLRQYLLEVININFDLFTEEAKESHVAGTLLETVQSDESSDEEAQR